MIKISTAGMTIRNFVPDDWHDLQRIIVDKEASEYALYDHPFPTGEREVKEITNWFSQGDSFLAVYEKAKKEVIGYIAINNENKAEYNLGYCFNSSFQDKGYATKACIAIINYVFKTLKAEKFATGTAVLNIPSCKLLAKLGFWKTGEGVTSFRKDRDGKSIEFTGASFELTREEWKRIEYSESGSL